LALATGGVVAAALLVVGCSRAGAAPSSRPGVANVVRVVDGDTIVARIGTRDEKIRLIGIDTPETVDPRKPVQCYGREASDRMKSLLPPGSSIRIERDVEERDIYRRLLAYVWRASDDLFVNRAMVADGYAHLLTIPPNVAFTDEFTRAAADARSSGLGLWRACAHE
jgi:micrococcal nuclease